MLPPLPPQAFPVFLFVWSSLSCSFPSCCARHPEYLITLGDDYYCFPPLSIHYKPTNSNKHHFKSSITTLLDKFYTNKTHKWTLSDLHNHIFKFRSKQSGSHFIQHQPKTYPTPPLPSLRKKYTRTSLFSKMMSLETGSSKNSSITSILKSNVVYVVS